MKIAVAGAGISGLSIARMLQPAHEVVLFEKSANAGGLVKCERINDCLFHKVGGHVFNAKNNRVLDWFWSHFNRDTEFVKARRNARVFFNDSIIGYPVENHLYLLGEENCRKIIAELLALQQHRKLPFEYGHFEAFLQENFGNTLYELYFKPYNSKIWQTDLRTVAMEWLEGKLPMPDLFEIMQNNILRSEETNMVHASFYYPREGGSQFIIDRLKTGLEIITGMVVDRIEKKDNRLLLPGDQLFDRLIYSGDIRALPLYCKQLLHEAGVDVHYLEQLRSNGTSNLFCETDNNDISWLYIPGNFTSAHRIIYTGNFSETNNRGSRRNTCVVEFSGKMPYDVMVNEIKKLPGNLVPLCYNYEPNSYVIQDKRTRAEVQLAKAVLKQHGIYLLGRFAEWEYYNMDKAIEAAFSLHGELAG